jgi:hypothetical protein
MNELSQHPDRRRPKGPKEILSESAQKRIDAALIEGSRARDAVLKQYSCNNPASELALNCQNFEYAITYLSTLQYEYKRAGVRGEQLREVMSEEIEGAVNSLGLNDAETFLHELLDTAWGW